MIIQRLAQICLLASIASLLGFPLAVIGYRWLNWGLGTSFSLIMATFFAALAFILVSFVVLGLAWHKQQLGALKLGIVALVILTIPFLGLSIQAIKGRSVPRIHDITTDLADPPQFSAVLSQRATTDNSLDYAGEEIAQQQQAAYPDIAPILTALAPDLAFSRSVAIINHMGWELVAQDAAAGRIEAVDTTTLWGFKDDLVVRIRSDAAGSRVDVRSVSRVGLSDMGANAERIRAFSERFNQ